MSKEFRIGLLALVAGASLYLGFNFLKGSDFLSSVNNYYVIYEDVNGLTVSNPVMLNGLSVGRVSNIKILQKSNNKLLVTLEVRDDLNLGKDTKAVLGDAGLLGGKTIVLDIGKSKNFLANGDTLQTKIDEGLLGQVMSKADPIIAKTDSIMTQVNDALKIVTSSKKSIKNMIRNIEEITTSANQTLKSGQIDQILRNANELTASLVRLERKFEPIVGKMDNLADKMNKVELEKTIEQANSTLANLNQILDKVNKGEGTLGALANDDSLYNNLNNMTKSLDKTIIDLRENPKRYVDLSIFGSKEKKKK